MEVKILKAINDQDIHKKSNIVEIKDYFMYKNHMVHLDLSSALLSNFYISVFMIS